MCVTVHQLPRPGDVSRTLAHQRRLQHASFSPNNKIRSASCVPLLTHSLPCDYAEFPTDKFAKRIVEHLRAQREAAMRKAVSPSQIDPRLLAQASAPAEEPQPVATNNIVHPPVLSGVPTASAPPMELFDPPPKQPMPQANNDGLAVSPWTQLFGRPHGMPSEPPLTMSAPPMEPEAASSAPSLPQRVASSLLQPTSTPMPSSSSGTVLPLPPRTSPFPDTEGKDKPLAASSSKLASSSVDYSTANPLGLSKAPHTSKRHRAPPIDMPERLLPPRGLCLQECRPMFETEEIWMPFVIPQRDILPTYNEWIRKLWWMRDVNAASLGPVSNMLCPAWRVAGDLSVHFHATASMHVQKSKGQLVTEHHDQSAGIRVENYVAIVCAVTPDTPFSNLMKLCVLSDSLPAGDEPSFFSWLLGARSRPKEMQHFPEPEGVTLDRDPNWYSAWYERANELRNDPTCASAVTRYVSNVPGFKNASVSISTIKPVGFSTLTVTPLRIPMYLCAYTHPSRSQAYHFVMSAQNGEIHDGGDRPVNEIGSVLMKLPLLGGLFSK